MVKSHSSKAESKPAGKAIYSVASPYPESTWPTIQPHDGDTILELLCRLLSPVGEYRKASIIPSKGKRSKKRKRATAQVAGEGSVVNVSVADVRPPAPAIKDALTIGFNSTQRRLESAARASAPHRVTAGGDLDLGTAGFESSSNNTLAAVFVDRFGQPPILHSHLPLLLAAASVSTLPEQSVGLVALPTGSEARLAATLRIPRVGLLGVEKDAPGAKPLLDFVKEHVPALDIPWLRDAQNGTFLPVEINAKTTTVPLKG